VIRRPGYLSWLLPVGAAILFFLAIGAALIVVGFAVLNNFLLDA
jgi:hypothetical protein